MQRSHPHARGDNSVVGRKLQRWESALVCPQASPRVVPGRPLLHEAPAISDDMVFGVTVTESKAISSQNRLGRANQMYAFTGVYVCVCVCVCVWVMDDVICMHAVESQHREERPPC